MQDLVKGISYGGFMIVTRERWPGFVCMTRLCTLDGNIGILSMYGKLIKLALVVLEMLEAWRFCTS